MKSLFEDPITLEGNVYIASDFHLGAPNKVESDQREKRIIGWLDTIKEDANHLILLGDIFDFWFEYRDVVPRGYFRLLAKLAELHDRGIQLYYFTGNHDMWVTDYFVSELGVQLFRQQQAFLINGKRHIIGHGDGLGPDDHGYKFIKWLFAQPVNCKLYSALPPRWAFAIARYFSRKSRAMTSAAEQQFMGNGNEMLVQYIQDVLTREEIDYFIYGHRHLPIELKIGNSTYINTGDWIMHDSYAKISAEEVHLYK